MYPALERIESSLTDLKKAKTDLITIQNKTRLLAEETTKKVDSMLNLLKEENPSNQKDVFKDTTSTMLELTTASDTILAEAEQLFKKVNSRLSVIDAGMVVVQHKYDAELISKQNKLDSMPPPNEMEKATLETDIKEISIATKSAQTVIADIKDTDDSIVKQQVEIF